jgi:hypothetical protein
MGMSKKRIKPPIKVRDMAAVSLRHFKAKVVPDAKKASNKDACRKYRHEFVA